MKKELIYYFFNDDELLRISNKIKKTEESTSGEICISIKEYRSFFGKNKPLKELAIKEFYNLGMDKTRDGTGILIFVLLEDRQFYILADKGINAKVPVETWDKISDEMQSLFVKGSFCAGIINGVEQVGKILSDHFPIKPGDTNELSNRVILK